MSADDTVGAMAEPGLPASRRRFPRFGRRGDTPPAEPGTEIEAQPHEVGEWHRHLELRDLPPAVGERLAFDEAAPRRVRNERVPAEAREIFHEVWNDIVADVYDEMAGRSRKQLFDKDVINRVLQRISLRMQRAERSLIVAAVHAPLPGDRDWKHIGVAGAGGGTGAVAEEVAAYFSAGTGATVAVSSAVLAELFETYVAASARTRQYQRSGRSADPELVATDLAESIGYSGNVGRRTNSDVTRAALAWMARQLVTRTSARFARGLVPVMGVAMNAGTSGRNVRRVVKLPLRPPSRDEVWRQAEGIMLEDEQWEATRRRFEEAPGLEE
jgi:hypothetical protein